MSGSDATEHTPGKYQTETAVAWTIVGVPLAYGVYNAVLAALQLFTG